MLRFSCGAAAQPVFSTLFVPSRLSHSVNMTNKMNWKENIRVLHNLITINAKKPLFMNTLASTCLFLLFQDGGLLINNPTALAIHECKCLWPNTPLQCVLSLGTGRYETAGKNGTTYTSLKAKLTNVISSATDTEGRFKAPSLLCSNLP